MIKNTAGQKIGAQMLTAADGTPFTGSVTVAVTGDAGAQATGSVGAGACVHEGNGYHTYAPAQAETNYDLAAFTFVGTGAIAVTVQIYTRAGDAFTRLGAPAGASVSADLAAVQVKTTNLPTDPADQSLIVDATTALASAIAALNNVSAAQVLAQINAALDTTLAAAIPADGTRPTLRQGVYMTTQFLFERTVSGTTMTVKNPDGTTLCTVTLSDAVTPLSLTRAT